MTDGLMRAYELDTGLDVLYMGYSDDPAVTKWGPGRRDHYIIHYVVSGKGYYNGNQVLAGQGFLITPGIFEEYYSEPDDPWHCFWIAANGNGMEKLLPYLKADRKTLIFDYSFAGKIRLAEQKIAIHHEGYCSPFELLEMFMYVFKNHVYGEKQNIREAELYADFAKNYIESHYSEKITVEEITRKLGISQPYLYRIFFDAFGKSPKQYIGDYRLFQAKALLEDTKLSVSQIGRAVGFEDVLSFSKFFSSREGCSPSAFRQNNERTVNP